MVFWFIVAFICRWFFAWNAISLEQQISIHFELWCYLLVFFSAKMFSQTVCAPFDLRPIKWILIMNANNNIDSLFAFNHDWMLIFLHGIKFIWLMSFCVKSEIWCCVSVFFVYFHFTLNLEEEYENASFGVGCAVCTVFVMNFS